MDYIVYVLYSDDFKKHYTGFTTNLAERLLSHNQRGNDWTKAFRPWHLIYSKTFIDKREAIQYEKWLKTYAGRDFIKTIVQ